MSIGQVEFFWRNRKKKIYSFIYSKLLSLIHNYYLFNNICYIWVMEELNSDAKRKGIWSNFNEVQLAAAIASLGSRVNQLKGETWRLNTKTRLPTSLWFHITKKLKIDHNEKIRHSLYKIWHSDARDVCKYVEEELKRKNTNFNDGNDGYINQTVAISVSENKSKLYPDPSLPLPQRPNTRSNEANDVDNDEIKDSTINQTSFILTPEEWKAAFSRSRQKLNNGWTKIFSDKLTSCGVTCAVRFRPGHIKEGKRKRNCAYLWCRADCTGEICTRSYIILLKEEVDERTSPMFRVRIEGEENHDPTIATMSRQLRGEERRLVGKIS